MKRTVCDNCRQVLKTTTMNCTQMSIDIIKLIKEFSHKNITLPSASDILRGANTKNIRDAGHNNLAAYNSCNQLSKIGKSLIYKYKCLYLNNVPSMKNIFSYSFRKVLCTCRTTWSCKTF